MKKMRIALALLISAFTACFVQAEENVVAKVGNTEYATIDEAVANWTAGSTLTLLADVQLSGVIKINSNESRTLDLGTHTMTAAKDKDAFQYVVKGCTSDVGLSIKADATNPGGITASGKAIIRHAKPIFNAPEKDRPYTQFFGGVFTASYIVYQGSNTGLTTGYTGANSPRFVFHGGTFNGTIYSNRSKNIFNGGTFNGNLQMSVDSSADALVKGGRFKQLSNLFGSTLNTDKFTIGSAAGVYDRGIYVDKDGYYVITSAPITEVSAKYPAVKKESYGSNDYFYYSAAATYGMFYEVASMAGTGSNVTIWEKPAVTIPENVTGEATVVEEIKNNTALKGYTPENLPTGAELEIELKSVGETIVYDVTPMANGAEVEPTEAITFRLPVPASVTEAYAKVYHEGTLMGIYAIQGEGSAKYVEVSSADFSEFAIEPIATAPVSKIGEVGYATFAEALTAAAAMTGDVTVEVLEKVTLNGPLSGSYASIKFVGKDTDAEIYLDVQGYVEAAGKKVAFEDLKLSKVAGGYITNAGFMNLAFGIYGATEVAYTNCTFLNGAYASSGKNTFTGCTFYRSHDRYGLWAYGAANIVVDGCTFADIRGIKMYDEGKAGTTNITVKNTDFTAADNKPAIVLTYGQSVTLENNTYSSKGVFELDLDGAPNGVTVTSDIAPTCVNDNGACGVLVDGKIYTTVAQAAAVATAGSTVTLLHDSAETVEFAVGVNLNKNGFTADGITVKQPVAQIGEQTYTTIAAAIAAAQAGDTVIILPGEYGAIDISNKNITIKGTVGDNGELLTTIKGGNPAITGHNFNGTIKDIKIVDAFKVMYAEPAGNVTVDNVYVTGATYGFHLVAYTQGLTWTIQNSYMNLSWANSFGVSGNGDAAIVIKGNTFASTNPYYPDYGALAVNTFLPNVTVEGNVFGENAKIMVRESIADTSKINISKNYHADGVDNAFVDDSAKVGIYAYYSDAALQNLVVRAAKIGDTYYASLEAAAAVAQAGDEIVLLLDATLTEKLTLPAGIKLNGNGKSITGAEVWADGNLEFVGHTKVTMFNAGYNKPTITIGEGACLELTSTGRMVIGHGATFNITGTITDAKTANVADITPSLIAAGASFTGAGVNFNVTNAYIKTTASYCSSSKSASGTFTFNVKNSIWEQFGKLAFEEQSTAATVKFYLTNSELTTTSHLVFGIAAGEVVIDNSNVNVGTSRQLENCSTMTIKNGSVVNGAVATSSNAKNPGTVIVENATYAVTGEFSGSDLGTGTIIVKKGAVVSAGSITKANIQIDATDMTEGELANFTANLSGLTGTLTVVNNDKLEASIVDGKIVLSAKPVAKIGDTPYATLEDAFKAATSGCTIDILDNVTVDYYWDARNTGAKFTVPVTINGNGKTIKFTNTVYDGGNYMSAFRFEDAATVKNLTIDMSEAVSGFAGRFRAISAKGNLTVDKCTFIGNGSENNTRAIIFGEGAGTATADVVVSITNSTFTGWKRGVSDNENAQDAKSVTLTGNVFTDANVGISASESVTFTGNTVADAYVDIRSYTANNTLDVTATGNTLMANTEANYNYIKAGGTVVAEGFEITITPVGGGTWGGIDWTLYDDGTLVIAPTKGAPVPDKNAPTKRTYEVGEWRETVIYKSNGSASAIGGAPYNMNAVKKLVIEEGVTKIGSFTGQFPNLTGEVIIPSTVTYFGQEAFHKTPITKLTFAEGGTAPLCIANGAFKKTLITEVAFPGDREYIHLHHWAFGGSTKLETAYIPANVTKCWGGEHVDYFDNFNSQTNPSWTYTSSIFTGCTAMQTITFESEAARDTFFGSNRNSTAEDPMVAYAGLTAYNTFAEALAAALESGEVLGLAKNVTVSDTVVIPSGKTLTFNLNGKTLSQSKACTAAYQMIHNKGNLTIKGNGKISFTDTSAGDPNFGWGSYTILNEGKLVVENGTIEHKGAQAFATHMICAIFQYSGSTTINGGTISTPNYCSARLWTGDMTINGGTFDGQLWVQPSNGNAQLTITGGTFEPNGGDASSVFVTNASHDVAVAISNGTFKGKIGCSDAAKLAGVVTGGRFTQDALDNTNVGIFAETIAFVVPSEDDEYYEAFETLQAAVDSGSAGTVMLVKDIALTEGVTVAAGKTIVLELNGKTISRNTDVANGTAAITNYGNLTIQDRSNPSVGKITAFAANPDTAAVPYYASNTISNYGVLTLESGTIENSTGDDARAAFPIDNNSSVGDAIVNIKGGTVTGRGAIRQFAASTTYKNEVNITGGTVVGTSYGVWVQNPGSGDPVATLTISGGEVAKILMSPSANFKPAITGGTVSEVAIWNADTTNTNRNPSGFITGGTFKNPISKEFFVEGYLLTKNEDGTYGVSNACVATIDNIGYTTLQAALTAAKAANMTDVTITLLGETTKTTTDTFNLYCVNVFNSLTFNQADASKVYYIEGIYTGSRANGGVCTFDGVNIVVTGQYIFEGNVKLINNSTITSTAEANCFIYNGTTTIEPGSKLKGVIDDFRGGKVIVDGGKTDGTYNETPDMQDAILIVNWSGDSLTLKNGAYVKVNAANEVGRLTLNAGTSANISASKLEACEYIAIAGGAVMNLDAASLVVTKKITGAGKIVVDATGFTGPAKTIVKADVSGFTGTIEVTGNPLAKYAVTSEGLVLEEGLAGAGTEADPFVVGSVAALEFFRDSVNKGETKYNAPGVYVALADDIDGITWERGIGDGINATYDGIFDGKGYTIKNVTLAPTADSDKYFCGGLFGYTYGAAVIKNLTIENITVTANGEGHNVGALVGFAYNKGGKLNVSNVTVKGDIAIAAAGTYGVGAIVGYSYGSMGTIDNCKVIGNNGSYIKGYSFVGGITGYSYSNATITDCSVENVTITATSKFVGGIAGIVLDKTTITDCTVAATTTINGTACAGAIIGAISGDGITLTIDNCTASGSLPTIGGNYANDAAVVAKVGNKYYASFTAAFSAAQTGDTITLLKPIVVKAGEELNLNKAVTIAYTSAVPGEDMITNKGTLIVDGASLIYTNTDTTASNVTVATISCEPGSVLEVKSGLVQNDSANNGANGIYAYTIDLLTNGSMGDVAATISGGKVVSTNYMAIRQFNNGTQCKNTLTITGGEITAAKRAIQIHMDNNAAYTTISGGTITAGEGGYALCFFPTTAEHISVTGGTFTGMIYSGTEEIISGGTFAEEPYAGYIAAGYTCTQNDDGTYTVADDPATHFIASLGDLIAFREDVNNGYDYEGVTVYLTADIDMASVDWSVNIGDAADYSFNGTFDGQNHKILNLNSTEAAQDPYGYICTGLFGCIAGDASIQNLILENVTINTGSFTGNNVAALVGFAWSCTGTIDNVTVKNVTINATKATGVGAIVGYDYYSPTLTIQDCTVDGTTINGASYVGGVIGYASNKITLDGNTVKNVSISAKGSVGGIAGIMLSGGIALDNTVTNVTLTATGELWANSVGAVAGTMTNGSIMVAGTTVTGGNVADIVGGILVEKPTAPIVKVQAQIGDMYYTTVETALDDAQDGTKVTVMNREAAEAFGEKLVATGGKEGAAAYEVATLLGGSFKKSGDKLVYDYAFGVSNVAYAGNDKFTVTVAIKDADSTVARELTGRTLVLYMVVEGDTPEADVIEDIRIDEDLVFTVAADGQVTFDVSVALPEAGEGKATYFTVKVTDEE